MKIAFSRVLLSAVTLVSLTSCDEMLMDPAYSSHRGGNSGYYRSYGSSYNNNNRYPRSSYGYPQRSYGSSRSRSLGYHPNDPDDRNNPSHPNYIGPPGSRSSRRSGSYYANDPDDRNNPRHPDYIGPAGSRSGRSRGSSQGGYHPNDPDDRNNPSHPDYIGPPGSRSRPSAPSYHPDDPDDRNNPSHPNYIGPPRR